MVASSGRVVNKPGGAQQAQFALKVGLIAIVPTSELAYSRVFGNLPSESSLAAMRRYETQFRNIGAITISGGTADVRLKDFIAQSHEYDVIIVVGHSVGSGEAYVSLPDGSYLSSSEIHEAVLWLSCNASFSPVMERILDFRKRLPSGRPSGCVQQVCRAW